jgi:hypothetical protein
MELMQPLATKNKKKKKQILSSHLLLKNKKRQRQSISFFFNVCLPIKRVKKYKKKLFFFLAMEGTEKIIKSYFSLIHLKDF